MVQILDKYGNTSTDFSRLLVFTKFGNIKKLSSGGGSPSGPAGGDLSGTYPNPSVLWANGLPTYDLVYYPIPTGTTSDYIRGDGSIVTFPTIPSVTPSALTKTDDTNVTITLGGTPTTALLQNVSLTLGWTGTLADARIASSANWNTAYTNRITALTTTGISGPATLIANTLNIPQYSGIIARNVVDTSPVTGSITETIINSLSIPAGTFAVGDIMKVYSFTQKLLQNGTYSIRYYINSSNTLVGASILHLYVSGATLRTTAISKEFYLKASNLIYAHSQTSNNQLINETTTTNNPLTLTFNYTNAFWIIQTITLVNITDAVIGRSFRIEKI